MSTNIFSPFPSSTPKSTPITQTTATFPSSATMPILPFPGLSSSPPSLTLTSTSTTTADQDEGAADTFPLEEPAKIIKLENLDEDNLFESRAKLQKFSNNEWVEIGVGTFSILKHKQNQKVRVVMRNSIGKLVLNSYLFSNMPLTRQKNGVMFPCVTEENKIEKFYLKVKEEDFPNLIRQLESNIPK